MVTKQKALLISWLLANETGTGRGGENKGCKAVCLLGGVTGNKGICLGCLGGFDLRKVASFAHIWKIIPASGGVGRFAFSPE